MGGFRFSFPACVIAGKGRIVTDDVLMLRLYVLPNGLTSFEDAVELLAMDDISPDKCPEWTKYLIESVTTFIVHGSVPTGMIDERKAAWLMRTIAIAGAVRSRTELEILLHAMEIASDVPESLSAFALDQVRLAMEEPPRGAYHDGRPAGAGMTNHDLAYIWRVLRGALDRGRLMLSPLEAAVLEDIDALADPARQNSGWQDVMTAVITLDRPKQNLRSHRWLMADDRQLLDDAAA